MIPPHMQEIALRAYREGDSAAEVHRLLWPDGRGATCSPHTLDTILRALVAHEEAQAARANASDELPTELADADAASGSSGRWRRARTSVRTSRGARSTTPYSTSSSSRT